ncbi:resolvase/recombinase [Eubacterium sp. CAG:786]|nr:resolvase/recombinase [Eubacterium sp. CAG:786]
MAIFGYARVSTREQNLERQLVQLREFVPDERYIITDKASGKDFDRRGYNSLVGTDEVAPRLQEGDLLVITSLDRLGRNYTEIKDQWNYITKTLKADIKVIEIPFLDTTSTNGNLDKLFIAELTLQILSYVSEKERINIRTRQRQGIDAMPVVDGKKVSMKTQRASGRPAKTYPDNWDDVYKRLTNGDITATKAMDILGLKRTTFYQLLHKYRNE